jgi:hypothetical protein
MFLNERIATRDVLFKPLLVETVKNQPARIVSDVWFDDLHVADVGMAYAERHGFGGETGRSAHSRTQDVTRQASLNPAGVPRNARNRRTVIQIRHHTLHSKFPSRQSSNAVSKDLHFTAILLFVYATHVSISANRDNMRRNGRRSTGKS